MKLDPGPDLTDEYLAKWMEEKAKVAKLREALVKFVMAEAPCAVCGYNGKGYFQDENHPCAKIWRLPISALDFARQALEKTK